MVNEHGQPHGFGRAIDSNNLSFIDGQWKNGVQHGYYRYIQYDGACDQMEFQNGNFVRWL